MWVNHHPEEEALVTKIFLLWKYNSIISLAIVGITILYSIFVSSIFPDFRSVTVTDLALTTLLFAVLNVVFRISTYGYIKRKDDGFRVDRIVALERQGILLNTYLSFIYSLVIFVFIGLGVAIVVGGGLSVVPFEVVEPTNGLIYASVVIVVIFLLSALSEILLWIEPFDVPEYLSD